VAVRARRPPVLADRTARGPLRRPAAEGERQPTADALPGRRGGRAARASLPPRRRAVGEAGRPAPLGRTHGRGAGRSRLRAGGAGGHGGRGRGAAGARRPRRRVTRRRASGRHDAEPHRRRAVSDRHQYDLLVKNVRLARPHQDGTPVTDIAVRDGRFARVAPGLSADDAREVVDGEGLVAFPGLVDAHMHVGIYSPLAQDAVTESKAAAMGGVTSAITYFRTGNYYLNKSGPYAEFYPE